MKVLRSILLFCSWYMLKRSLTQRKSFFIASSLQFKADVAKLRKAGKPLEMGNMISEQKASTADEKRQQQICIFHPSRFPHCEKLASLVVPPRILIWELLFSFLEKLCSTICSVLVDGSLFSKKDQSCTLLCWVTRLREFAKKKEKKKQRWTNPLYFFQIDVAAIVIGMPPQTRMYPPFYLFQIIQSSFYAWPFFQRQPIQ